MTKIDEQTLKDAVARGIPKAGGYVPPTYSPPSDNDDYNEVEEIEQQPKRNKRERAIDEYRAKYLARNDVQGRQMLYVSEEIHNSLCEVVKVVGGKKATMLSYVENILREHLSEHKELLNGVHKRKYKCPIGW